MKTLLLTLTVLFLFAINSYSQDTFVKVGNSVSNDAEVNLISSDNSKTVIDIKINGFYNRKVSVDGKIYDNIYLNDYVSLGEPGQASLPTITKFIAIPNYKDVKVVIDNATFQTLDSYEIIPYQVPPLRNSTTEQVSFVKDNNYYSRNGNLPEDIISIKEIAVLRDYRVAVVSINPVQFNPSLRQIKVYTDIRFELKYEGYSDVNNVVYQGETGSKIFGNIYKNLILNYSDNPFTSAPKMLIIIADDLRNSILPYANWKIKKGIKTTIKRKLEISKFGDPTAQQIKDYLITQYNSPDRPDFVLIVGDAAGSNTVTWFTTTGGKSDHPYSCLAGTDILPDIVVGRISVQSTAELDSAVIKLVQYEKQPNMTETEWYKRAFVLHSNDGIDPINGQLAKNVFLNEGGFTNVDMVSPSATQSQITQYINGGVSWIWFIGHGSATSWASPVWNMSNMVNLNFGRRQPQIISIACSNADLDYSQTANCFAEAWIERSPQNSASNIGAYTELCAFYTTDTIAREMLYAYFRHGIYDFGSMMNWGKIKAYEYFNGNGTVTETINQMMVLGDPSQETYSDVPKTINVASSLIGPNYKINIKTNGQNVKGALVAINQNEILKISGYTDSLGNYSFNSSYIENSIPVNLVVTGKNLNPYDDLMILTSVNSILSMPNGFSLSQNFPNPFNPNTVISYELQVTGYTSLKVYNVLGIEVATLVNEKQNAGSYQVEFDGSNLSSGVYFYKLTAGDYSDIKKMTLLK